MPIETTEVFSYLGAPPEIDSLDKFKEYFDKSFIKQDYQAIKDNKDLYGRVTGAYNESNKVALKRAFKENGVDLSGEDLDKMHIGEAISTILPKVLKNYSTEISTLKEAAGKGVNEKVAAVQTDFEKYKAEVMPKIEQYEKLNGEFETFKQAVAQKEVQEKINKYDEQEWGKFGFSQTTDPYTKKGFMSEVDAKYQSKIFDDGIYPVDEKGNRIPDPARAGAWKSKSQIAIELADEAEKSGARLRAKVEQRQMEVKKPTIFQVKEQEGKDGKDPPQGRKLNTGTRAKVPG